MEWGNSFTLGPLQSLWNKLFVIRHKMKFLTSNVILNSLAVFGGNYYWNVLVNKEEHYWLYKDKTYTSKPTKICYSTDAEYLHLFIDRQLWQYLNCMGEASLNKRQKVWPNNLCKLVLEELFNFPENLDDVMFSLKHYKSLIFYTIFRNMYKGANVKYVVFWSPVFWDMLLRSWVSGFRHFKGKCVCVCVCVCAAFIFKGSMLLKRNIEDEAYTLLRNIGN